MRATLYAALSLRQSVHPSVRPTLIAWSSQLMDFGTKPLKDIRGSHHRLIRCQELSYFAFQCFFMLFHCSFLHCHVFFSLDNAWCLALGCYRSYVTSICHQIGLVSLCISFFFLSRARHSLIIKANLLVGPLAGQPVCLSVGH